VKLSRKALLLEQKASAPATDEPEADDE
jgi:hypothetical protein